MSVAVISGSAGLIGSEAAVFFAESRGLEIIGIDNDMRREFFGDDASTAATSLAFNTDSARSTNTTRPTSGISRQ